jgi:hypothetical protein
MISRSLPSHAGGPPAARDQQPPHEEERDQRQAHHKRRAAEKHGHREEFQRAHRGPPDVEAVGGQEDDGPEQDAYQRRRIQRVVRALGVEDADVLVTGP